ncbi:hypothetical protein [Paenibacillus kobensis]|uniref:hypothetical protein n=1 Tax=Paenibacillus kobensis TaxID=59841 RepID=UPI0015808D2D|nr:hypothetical protein [Paenibacillus kobensis]
MILIVAGILYIRGRRTTKRKQIEVSRQGGAAKQDRIIGGFAATPDYPEPFGYKCQWFAVKTLDTQAVIEAMKMKDVQVSNWKSGIEGSYEGYYFVSPPVEGWTLVVNPIMPDLSGAAAPSPLIVIDRLSSRFGEACYFATHRVVEYHAWAKSIHGKIVRAYGYVGEIGETIIDEGEMSEEERENDVIFTGLDADEPRLPSEEDVLLMAAQWTIDPMMPNDHYDKGTGFVGVVINEEPLHR